MVSVFGIAVIVKEMVVINILRSGFFCSLLIMKIIAAVFKVNKLICLFN